MLIFIAESFAATLTSNIGGGVFIALKGDVRDVGDGVGSVFALLAVIAAAVTGAAFSSPTRATDPPWRLGVALFFAAEMSALLRPALAPPSFFGLGSKKEEVKGKVVPTGKGDEEELSESKKLLKQVKDAGVAGIISYIFWEWAFWGVSIPVCIFGYYEVTGHWPDFNNQDDLAKLGAEAFAFVNVARFAVPLRIGLALSTTPWVEESIVSRFVSDEDDDDAKAVEEEAE